MMQSISNAFGTGFQPGKVRLDRDVILRAMGIGASDASPGIRPPDLATQVSMVREALHAHDGLASC